MQEADGGWPQLVGFGTDPNSTALVLQARLPNARPLHRLRGRCHVPSLADYDGARTAFIASVFGAAAAR